MMHGTTFLHQVITVSISNKSESSVTTAIKMGKKGGVPIWVSFGVLWYKKVTKYWNKNRKKKQREISVKNTNKGIYKYVQRQ